MTVFGSVELIEKSLFYIKATILDPRFKIAAFTINSDTVEHAVLPELAILLKNKSNYNQ